MAVLRLRHTERTGVHVVAERRQTTQSIAWFWDLYKRDLLQMDPPYQRRSVWSQPYKDYFIDTILLRYPAPAIFLFEDITDDGTTKYSVVDGKQRLSALFEFLKNEYPVYDGATVGRLRGLYFADLESSEKRDFYGYQFSIEFLPTTDEGTLNNIFDRINKNVARLTRQELRHAKYSGLFTTSTESLSEYMDSTLSRDFPRVATQSRRQMKDVELVAQLLILTETGVKSQSQDDLDAVYSELDEEWGAQDSVEAEFKSVVGVLASWQEGILASSGARRLRNQADFYSLYGAILDLIRSDALPPPDKAVERLDEFMTLVSTEDSRAQDSRARNYFDAARSASNDAAQRRDRIRILTDVLIAKNDDGDA